MNTTINNAQEREEIENLLPWYAAGTLSRRDIARVENALAGDAEFGLARHAVDLLAHLAECGIDALALGLGILGDGMLDDDAGLVEHGLAARHALDQL